MWNSEQTFLVLFFLALAVIFCTLAKLTYEWMAGHSCMSVLVMALCHIKSYVIIFIILWFNTIQLDQLQTNIAIYIDIVWL